MASTFGNHKLRYERGLKSDSRHFASPNNDPPISESAANATLCEFQGNGWVSMGFLVSVRRFIHPHVVSKKWHPQMIRPGA